MPTSIKQIKDLNNTLHDLDNRSVTLTSTSGTLTTDQFNLLQESNQNYILYNSGLYRRVYNNGTDQVIFHRIGPAAKVAQYFTINPTTRVYSYVSSDISGDVSGSGTNGSLVKWSGNKTVTNGPALGSSTTTFLRNDGTWATPSGTGAQSIILTSTSGTLTSAQLQTLQSSDENYIAYSNGIYRKTYGDTTSLYYQRQGVAAIPEQNQWFTITISTGAYAYSTFSNSDTKVTQSESSSNYWRKIILSHNGDGTPTAGITTTTDNVYEAIGISAQPSTGTIRSTVYRVADNVELVYNTTTKSLDFNFL